MSLTPDQITADQNFINQQYGGYFDASGQYHDGSVFNSGSYDPYANISAGNMAGTDRNNGILGWAVSQGIPESDLASVLNIPQSSIDSYIGGMYQNTDPHGGNYTSLNPMYDAQNTLTSGARLATSQASGQATPMTNYDLAGLGYVTGPQQTAYNGFNTGLQSTISNFYAAHPGVSPYNLQPQLASYLQANNYGQSPNPAGALPGAGGSLPGAGGASGAGSAGGTLPGGVGGSGSGAGGGGFGGMGAFGGSFTSTRGPMPTLSTSYTENPYLAGQMDDLARRSNLALQDSFRDIRSGAQINGQMGGSRQGIAEGVAASRAADTLQGQMANVLGTDYTNQANRNLSKYGIDMSNYNTQGSQDLTRYGIDTQAALGLNGQNQNFYTANRGQDLAQAALGSQLYGQGTQGYLSQGQGVQGIGTTQQQAQWNPITNGSNILNQYTGFGSTNATTSSGGGPNGVLGGAIAGGQIANNLGFGYTPTNFGGNYSQGGIYPYNTGLGD